MKSILITAIGGDIAQCVAKILREIYPDWYLVGADMSDRHAGPLYSDKCLQAPAASDEAYLDWLENTARDEKIDFCIPLSEAELDVLSNNGLTRIAHAEIVAPGAQAIRIGNDKLATAEFLETLGLPVPWTAPSSKMPDAENYPCIYKPRSGAGSKAIFVCKDINQASFYAATNPNGVFQELLLPADREVTCAIYRNKAGDISVIQLLRQLAGGLTGWAKVIKNAEIDAQCRAIAGALNLDACSINVQLRLTDNGPRIFEINARFSSTTLMRHRMGFQDVVWAMKERLGEPISMVSPAAGTIGLRTCDAVIGQEP